MKLVYALLLISLTATAEEYYGQGLGPKKYNPKPQYVSPEDVRKGYIDHPPENKYYLEQPRAIAKPLPQNLMFGRSRVYQSEDSHDARGE